MTWIETLSANRNRQFWLLQVLGWTGWMVLFALRGFQSNTLDDPVKNILMLFVSASAGLLLSTGLRFIYRAVWESSLLTRMVTIAIASYVAAAIWQPFKNYAATIIWYSDKSMYSDDKHMVAMDWLWLFEGIIPYSYFLLLCWSGLYFGIKYHQLLQEQIQKNIRAEAMAHEAQLKMLRYQLNPHFLFNTLNAISTLILEKDNSRAGEMLGKLSSFLRYSLDKDPMKKVSLEHEIDTLKLYLDIEKVRFGDRLTVDYDIEDKAALAMLPSLIMQPLVENALKYAVAERIEGGIINIRARVFAGDLMLEVEDNGPGLDMSGGKLPVFTGVGINNTRERLKEIYEDRHACRFSNTIPHGLKIEIRIPYETHQS